MLPRAMKFIGAGIVLVSLLVALGFVSILPWAVIGVLCAVVIGVFGWLINLESKTKDKALPPRKSAEDKELGKRWIANREILLEPGDYETFAVDLKRDELLPGEIASDYPIGVFLVSKYASTKYENGEDFSYEECGGENIKRTSIEFSPTKAEDGFS